METNFSTASLTVNPEINCGNFSEDKLTEFVNSFDGYDEIRKTKLKFLVKFYLFKGNCYTTFTRKVTRKIIKKGNTIQIYGGNFKMKNIKMPTLSFSMSRPSEEQLDHVIIPINVFNVIVDTTPFVSYTIFSEISKQVNTDMTNYNQIKLIVIDVLGKNLPGVNEFSSYSRTEVDGIYYALNIVKFSASIFLVAGALILQQPSLLPSSSSSPMFFQNRQNIIYTEHKFNKKKEEIEIKSLTLCNVYLNLVLYIAYQRKFSDFKIPTTNKNKFINIYFPEPILRSIGKNASNSRKEQMFVNTILRILNNPEQEDAYKKLEELGQLQTKELQVEMNKLQSEVQRESQNGVQGGKKVKIKRLVDCTVKELKVKMKKKGKKLSKDGVPLTKSQMIKSLKK